MYIRIPDTYYTQQMLDGTPEPDGPAPLIQFYCGEDIVLAGYFDYGGVPVRNVDWVVTAVFKRGVYDPDIIYTATLGNGVANGVTDGSYQFTLPAALTATLVAGMYWMDVVITGVGGTHVIGRFNFSLDYTASNQLPSIQTIATIPQSELTSVDPIVGPDIDPVGMYN